MSTNVKQYPFPSKKQIAARIATEADYACTCLLVLYARQTEHEREVKGTINKNRRGFMSSHAVNGSKLSEKVLAGEALEPEELSFVQELVSHYGKQLAAHFRQEMIEKDPSLAEAARVFSAS